MLPTCNQEARSRRGQRSVMFAGFGVGGCDDVTDDDDDDDDCGKVCRFWC